MLDKNTIANLALGRLGTSLGTVNLVTDNSTQARILRLHFRSSLDALLKKHPWNFATGFSALAIQTEQPTMAWGYSYYLPSDCINIRQIAENGCFPMKNTYNDQKPKYRQVYSGGSPVIYCSVPYAHAEYTVRVPEDDMFPDHFGRALAAQLSKDIAPSLITNNYAKVKATLNSDADNDITLGIAEDIGEEPQQEDSDSQFVRARFQ